MKNKLTTEKFIERANKIHNNTYDYSLINYKNSQTKIKIICPEHGIFEQMGNTHLQGSGCCKCSYKHRNNSRKLNNSIFIKKANKIHNSQYDYSLVNYTVGYDKVKIICPEHGMFEQTAESHLQEHGCKKCGVEKRSKNRTSNTSNFIKKATLIHGNQYDYTLVDYKNSQTKVKIVCLEHGVFQQKVNDHISNKAGCPVCKKNKLSLGLDTFIIRSNKIHNNKYDYSLVKYNNSYEKIKIICPEHGMFEQTPHSHLKGYGCKKCGRGTSKYEDEIIDYLKNELKIKNILENDRNILEGKELDIYLPTHNLAIEFNGLYWHSELFKSNDFHLKKTNLAESRGIQLLHIFEDEWIYKSDIVKSIIKSKLGLIDNKIYGRKCIIKEINQKESKEFLNQNHIQGAGRSSIRLGLFYNNELISVMIFVKSRKSISYSNDSYELNRFCNKLNTNIIGGASKLLKYFTKNYELNEIISFADRRYFNGKVYNTIGFKLIHKTKADYSYFNNNQIKRYHRFGFRKEILQKNGFDVNESEHEIMLKQGYYRIYDCGKLKYRFQKNK